jgi:hypothetical protein
MMFNGDILVGGLMGFVTNQPLSQWVRMVPWSLYPSLLMVKHRDQRRLTSRTAVTTAATSIDLQIGFEQTR